MNTVSTLIEIRDNMSTLDSYLTSSDSVESNYAKNLIGRGFCYVADNSDGMYRFYPSRFIGYANNSMKNHVNNDTKSGFETNPIISKVIKYNPEKSDTLDKEFNNYCKYLNIIPKKNQRG